MVVTWPRTSSVVPRGSLARHLGDDLLDARAHAAQVAAVHVGVDVEHRLHVVVVDDLPARRRGRPSTRLESSCGLPERSAGIAVGRGRLIRSGADAALVGLAEPAIEVAVLRVHAVERRDDRRAQQRRRANPCGIAASARRRCS